MLWCMHEGFGTAAAVSLVTTRQTKQMHDHHHREAEGATSAYPLIDLYSTFHTSAEIAIRLLSNTET